MKFSLNTNNVSTNTHNNFTTTQGREIIRLEILVYRLPSTTGPDSDSSAISAQGNAVQLLQSYQHPVTTD